MQLNNCNNLNQLLARRACEVGQLRRRASGCSGYSGSILHPINASYYLLHVQSAELQGQGYPTTVRSQDLSRWDICSTPSAFQRRGLISKLLNIGIMLAPEPARPQDRFQAGNMYNGTMTTASMMSLKKKEKKEVAIPPAAQVEWSLIDQPYRYWYWCPWRN